MRVRLTAIILYAAVFTGFATGSVKSFVLFDAPDSTTLQQQRPVLGLDLDGKRGLVLFHHNPHESLGRISD
ncbi:MAG: hypothetical protein DMF60_12400, partial [Acidobacteria bacterium]